MIFPKSHRKWQGQNLNTQIWTLNPDPFGGAHHLSSHLQSALYFALFPDLILICFLCSDYVPLQNSCPLPLISSIYIYWQIAMYQFVWRAVNIIVKQGVEEFDNQGRQRIFLWLKLYVLNKIIFLFKEKDSDLKNVSNFSQHSANVSGLCWSHSLVPGEMKYRALARQKRWGWGEGVWRQSRLEKQHTFHVAGASSGEQTHGGEESKGRARGWCGGVGRDMQQRPLNTRVKGIKLTLGARGVQWRASGDAGGEGIADVGSLRPPQRPLWGAWWLSVVHLELPCQIQLKKKYLI